MIKENRLKHNYTQEKLAEILGISPRQLQRIEKDASKTRISTLKKIITVLEISDTEILNFIRA